MSRRPTTTVAELTMRADWLASGDIGDLDIVARRVVTAKTSGADQHGVGGDRCWRPLERCAPARVKVTVTFLLSAL